MATQRQLRLKSVLNQQVASRDDNDSQTQIELQCEKYAIENKSVRRVSVAGHRHCRMLSQFD